MASWRSDAWQNMGRQSGEDRRYSAGCGCLQSKLGRCSAFCLVFMLSCLLLFGIALFSRARFREHEVEKYRNPLLAALDSSVLCQVPIRHPRFLPHLSTCALELGSKNDTKFDLRSAENVLLGFVFGMLLHRDLELMEEILSGAHVCFEDPGRFIHSLLVHLPGAYHRRSSHRSTSLQVGIKEGRVLHTILIGTDPHGVTWFQLEGSPWDPKHSLWKSYNHILDCWLYFLTGRQMGPLGTSRHTDRNPLHLGAPSKPGDACKELCESRSMLSLGSTMLSHVEPDTGPGHGHHRPGPSHNSTPVVV